MIFFKRKDSKFSKVNVVLPTTNVAIPIPKNVDVAILENIYSPIPENANIPIPENNHLSNTTSKSWSWYIMKQWFLGICLGR